METRRPKQTMEDVAEAAKKPISMNRLWNLPKDMMPRASLLSSVVNSNVSLLQGGSLKNAGLFIFLESLQQVWIAIATEQKNAVSDAIKKDRTSHHHSHKAVSSATKANRNDTTSADEEVTFENAWGIVMNLFTQKVLKEADTKYQQKQPFMAFVMTTSNHKPYTYPANKIDIPSGSGREGAVKYADFAIGELIRNAKAKALGLKYGCLSLLLQNPVCKQWPEKVKLM
ncbi:hypothetical protein FQR65_LT19582 [Abscondita terminalis]|nr:hypothetical protein FQR65_LT19582 [Abscondita terminalis]